MGAMRWRISRYVRRAMRRKKSMAKLIGGRRTRLTSARRQSIHIMNTTMPTSLRPSRAMVIAPAANISLSTSTSVVTRDTSFPTGVRSKYRIGKRCTRAKTAPRSSARLRWATTMVRYCWP